MADLFGDLKKSLNITLEYGQGYREMQYEEKHPELCTEIYDFTKDIGMGIFDYHLHKIVYSLNDKQQIQSLKTIYKNRNDGTLKTLLDTTNSHINGEKEEEIVFQDFEDIVQIFFYVQDDKINARLVAICIETNLGNIKYIGNQDNGQLLRDFDLDTKENIVLGFGVNANQHYGVSSMFCYIMNKNKYGIIEYSGLLQLRAKIKKDKDFKTKNDEKRASLTDKQNLLLNIADLPDTAFFPIAGYLMAH